MMRGVTKQFLAALLTVVLAMTLASCGLREERRPLACLSLAESSGSFSETVAETLAKKLEDYGYRVYVVFCDSIKEQSAQIMNFITMRASIIIVDCAGESEVYEELFSEASEAGCRLAVLGGDGSIENCAVQVINYSVLEGMRMCELVSRFLDDRYADANPGEVKVLLLPTITKSEQARAYAGYCLLTERYIRRFDLETLRFVREDTGETVYCRNAFGEVRAVEEPTGGLLLDEEGYAVLNPYYDARVELRTYSVPDLQTAIDGQTAIDAVVAKNEEINVVVAMNGNVAVGAAERVQYYERMQMIDLPPDQLAVFGEGDTPYNRELVLKSAHNESVLRGFVGQYKIEWEADRIISALIYGGGDVPLYMYSLNSAMAPDAREVGIVTKLARYRNILDDPNVFFAEDE